MKELLDVLQKIIHEKFLPQYRPFDKIVVAQTVQNHLSMLTDLGFLYSSGTQVTDEVLWGAESIVTSISWYGELLSSLAEISSDLAYTVHLQSSSERMVQKYTLGDAAIAITGLSRFLGRNSLGRYFSGQSLHPDDEKILSAAFSATTDRTLVLALEKPTRILYPFWQDGDLSWATATIAAESAKKESKQSGFDSCYFYTFSIDTFEAVKLTADKANAAFVELLTLNSIGFAAIERGLLRRALVASLEYINARKQGGKLIREYPLVQQMLFKIQRALQLYDNFFNGIQAFSELGLVEAATCISLHSALKVHAFEAATSAVQLHGGYGYMQDYGMERVLRDIRFLASYPYSTKEIEIFLAEIMIQGQGQANV